jgi:uncharacterized protein YjbJ (UPF0337 family)
VQRVEVVSLQRGREIPDGLEPRLVKNLGCSDVVDGTLLAPLRTAVIEGGSMDWNQIQGQWKQLKGKAKIKWGKLTDDEIDVVEGRRDELVGKIQQRYGIAKDQAEREVDDWMKEF